MLGREREWALIERSLAALPGGGVVIALEGSPGIGKTTLWQQAIGQARRLGFGVRATAPGEPDAGLAFAGLGDLLDCLPEQILRDLPAPQRRAVSLALVVDSDTGSPDQGALLRGALGALRSVVATTPLLIAIDDEQWLDAPTARVLGFALPRLRDAPIGVVMTRRPATDGALWTALAADGGGERLLRQTIEPLDLAALDALLANRIGHRLPRPLVRRIHVGSGGNPLYALAIARELQNRPDRGGNLPIPRTLADAISRRLHGLGERAHEPLLAVAASAPPARDRGHGCGEPAPVSVTPNATASTYQGFEHRLFGPSGRQARAGTVAGALGSCRRGLSSTGSSGVGRPQGRL